MTINEIQDEIIQEFEVFDDWMDRYALLIEIGKELAEMPSEYKTDQNLISGCQSNVWFHAEFKEGKIYFTADSDAVITKGIAALLIRVLSERTPKEILETDLYFIKKTGLQQHLSPTRSNGLLSMIKQLKLYAMAFNALK
ncbi:MAG: SufE family protein [Bacteroidota bacterium]|jgi:cysteine desulfuration protein SufE|nr:SufE family protein [Bacteroidales bacterium]MDI9534985.1 SufE family protein [Bacteroidota bacterium]OQC44588.1 MAG: Cysteine desulfuration protein SufE [Bacteroidetes bacterium ADurb.Bin028]NLP19502.1 SufE family protein [Bacteroidales bacterium]HNY44164.1 SufE family protein [Bacteroidales bacterium]